MAFYTAEWVRKLLKEDHVNLQKHLKVKDKNFRTYIDSVLPFVLFVDIASIRKNIITPNAPFIKQLGDALQLPDNQIIIDELDKAYKKVINYYISSYKSIDSTELNSLLEQLRESFSSGNIKGKLESIFKNTFIISNISKPNKSVLIISPRFNTIQSKFGSVFKEVFDYSKFSDIISDGLDNSPRNIVKTFLEKRFVTLQNLGHTEIDIISSEKGSTEVKRGLVTPRLIQAIVDWPKDSKIEPLVRKFSKETGQARTRVKIRKRFSKSKLVLEMLIETGIMIGSVESPQENLLKAPDERRFTIGRNLTARIIANPRIITDLESSKTLKQYLVDAVINSYESKNIGPYNSEYNNTITTPIERNKVKVEVKKKSSTSTNVPHITTKKVIQAKQQAVNLISLQSLINQSLFEQIKKNMGKGERLNVLNYRTGRFARSAEVKRMTMSREGAITAFYEYMKNPYATFSEGGIQSRPRTRDPKLLISKSIREIAATKVANRLRAVAV